MTVCSLKNMIFILDNKNIKSNENRIEGNEGCSFDDRE